LCLTPVGKVANKLSTLILLKIAEQSLESKFLSFSRSSLSYF
jgi:hypothetical protein